MRALGPHSVSSFLATVLTIASVGLWIVLAIAVCLTMLLPWIGLGSNWQLGIPAALAIDAPALHVAAPSLGVETASLTDVTGTLQFAPPSRRMLIAPMLMIVVMLAIVIWVLEHLRAVFRSLRGDQVFAPANVRHVKRVGWAVILAEPVRAAFTYSSHAYARSHFVGDGLRFATDLDLNLGTIFSGLVILVLAEIFRAGTRLDEDQSLTI
jgi:hypothetical protein